MGKSTASKHVAITWADDDSDQLSKFQFTFHITLKQVKDDVPVEQIIVSQHHELEATKVTPEEIKYILEGCTNGKILLVMDGHDEYTPGTNSDIDNIILKRKFGNCSLILTSRETEQIIEIKEYMDIEAEIRGFHSPNVTTYIKQSLGSEEETGKFLKQASSNGMCLPDKQGGYIFNFSILQVPILLNMLCTLFKVDSTLPKTKTGIMESVKTRYTTREAKRTEQASTPDNLRETFFKLGKLAWHGLMQRRYNFTKVNKAFN